MSKESQPDRKTISEVRVGVDMADKRMQETLMKNTQIMAANPDPSVAFVTVLALAHASDTLHRLHANALATPPEGRSGLLHEGQTLYRDMQKAVSGNTGPLGRRILQAARLLNDMAAHLPDEELEAMRQAAHQYVRIGVLMVNPPGHRQEPPESGHRHLRAVPKQ